MWYAGMQLTEIEVQQFALSPTSLAQAHVVSALTPTSRGFFCQRCGQKSRTPLPNGRAYCPHCVTLGRLTTQTRLFRFGSPPLTVSGDLRWPGHLTPAQQRAAEALQLSIDKGRDHLLWAVTGAGKTEMLFQPLARLLKSGRRVAFASPRVDVVLEVAPRLQAAFPDTPMAVRYGGAPWPSEEAALVVCTTHQLMRYYKAFDVVVVDEVDAFPYRHDPMLAYAVHQANRGSTIYLSATPPRTLLQAARQGQLDWSNLTRRFHGGALPVPTIRLVPHQGLPNQLTAVFWRAVADALTDGRQCLLFVPAVAWGPPIVRQLEAHGIEALHVDAQDSRRQAKITQFRAGVPRVLVTTTILERGVTVAHCAVIVLAADSTRFGAAALVQMAGRAGRAADSPNDPVIFLARHYAVALRQAVAQIRRLNRQSS